MGSRRKGREGALKALYALEYTREQGDREAAVARCLDVVLELPEETRGFAQTLVDGVRGQWDTINELIAQTSKRWKIERMAIIDRNILRIATFEIRFRDDIPVKVAINEAIEIAKKFGSQESPAFVNGILDRIAEQTGRLRGGEDE